MSVTTRQICCPLPRANDRREPARPTVENDLGQRYLDGDEHQRLCLWLQHREVRRELDKLGAQQPPMNDGGWNLLRRWLGLPGL